MSWLPEATVTINGTNYNSLAIANVQIGYGRTSIWEQARAGYARIQILNDNGSSYNFDMNQSVTIKVHNSSGVDVTLFTGIITQVDNVIQANGAIKTVAVHQITALAPFAAMNRKTVGSSDYPKESDTARITRILNECGVTIDTVDSPSIYEFKTRSASPTNGYSLASEYAQQAFGYLYETADGKVGFANESRRTLDVASNGYTVLPNNYVLWNSVKSQKSLNEVLNYVTVSYRAGTEIAQSTGSQASYGLIAAQVSTDLHNQTDAATQAERYVTLRSLPRTSLDSFTIQLDSDNVSDANRDKLLNMRMGFPLQFTSLPAAIKNSTYQGFVEGWTINFTRYQYQLTLTTSDSIYSLTPTRWQDVSATLKWQDVDAALQWANYN